MAASICRPVAMPPAAMTGTVTVSQTAGMSDRVVVSSLPLWPPASNPSATMASTPAASHLAASLLLGTTCTTVIPAAWSMAVYFFGLPAEVNTIFTPSSMRICIKRSISGYISGTFTPHGLSVAALSLVMCSTSVSGCMEPAPSSPRPPALLTAAASRHPLHHTMPPCMTGCSIPKSFVILFCFIVLIGFCGFLFCFLFLGLCPLFCCKKRGCVKTEFLKKLPFLHTLSLFVIARQLSAPR